MTEQDPNSTAALEQEVASGRARIEETVEEIQRRLSPGQLVDEVLLLSRSTTPLAQQGRAFGTELVKAVSQNPLPAALACVGVAWLVLASLNRSSAPGAVEPSAPDGDHPPA